MVNDSQILRLSLELLVGVLAGGEHLRLGPRLAHLRGHLVCGYRVVSIIARGGLATWSKLTVVASEQEVKDGLQAEDAEEVPANARHPPRVHILRHDAGLQHALELDRDRERQFH